MPSSSTARRALHLLLAAGAPFALPAQDSTTTLPARIDSGAVVRVTAPRRGIDRLRARAVASRGDSLTVRRATRDYRDSLDVTVAWQDVTELSVSRGIDRGAGARRGAVTGALVVGIPGAALTAGFLWYDWRQDQRHRCYDMCYFGPAILGVMTVAGTATGAVVGALIGAGVGRERWEATGIPARVGVAPVSNGVGLRLAF